MKFIHKELKCWMSKSVDPDETAHYEPSHLDLRCLQKLIYFACGSEKKVKYQATKNIWSSQKLV